MNRRLLAELVDEADIVFHLAAAVGYEESLRARYGPSKSM